MIRTFNVNEMPYPYLPPEEEFESLRVQLPNRVFDPKIGASLLNRYLDQHIACDELGINIMVNEHHQTATNLGSATPVTLGMIARETKNARLLILGSPIAVGRDPIRLAEEMAIVDNISYGRLECGFVRGVPFEFAAANSNPVKASERMWEAHDLILKAFTTHDGPFNWEGKYHRYRQVNIWPRPYQEPHPPIWFAAQAPQTAFEIGKRGHIMAQLLGGIAGTKAAFDAYRAGAVAAGLYSAPEEVPLDRFTMSCMVSVGDTDEKGLAGAHDVMWYLRNQKAAPQWANPPGYMPAEQTARLMKIMARGGNPAKELLGIDLFEAGGEVSTARLIEHGILVAGNPDTVFDQVKRFYEGVGGFGNMIVMFAAGPMSNEDVITRIERWAKEVQPRVNELNEAVAGAPRSTRDASSVSVPVGVDH